MPDSPAKAVAELLLRDGYVDNELDARRAAKWILCLAEEPRRPGAAAVPGRTDDLRRP
jgi:hypothetical protein